MSLSPTGVDNLTATASYSPITADPATSQPARDNRYSSSAGISGGNSVKFHVDGCAYFWAVSEALLVAKESVWILGWWVSPEVYLRRPPSEKEEYRLDHMLRAAAERGVKVNVVVFKEVPLVMILSSDHTKRTLEALHPNVAVLVYPDHIVDPRDMFRSADGLLESISTADTAGIAQLPDEKLQTLFDLAGGPTLLWTHHEKLVIVDQQVAFMGGIDLSYGRWDTIQHPISDVHPGNSAGIVFPGQDYNNVRVMDFKDVAEWQKNTVERLVTARMGWEDISISLTGPTVVDLCHHFVDRWNFIQRVKYGHRLPGSPRYEPLLPPKSSSPSTHEDAGSVSCQLVRSVSGWSHGTATENSIYNAYIETIEKSEHFVYIEQQFFITATDQKPGPVWNRVGEALVARILRAAGEHKRYQVIVVMPAVPAFPGDLQNAITGKPPRAIMQLQYESLSRGGSSVLDNLRQAGVDPDQYIRFFNLRSYDRLNGSGKDGDWETVSSCCMLSGKDIRDIPWPAGGPLQEIDAFVTEELYVHTKVLIADDKVVICGSANLNDRSFKGSRDSEIALVVEDRTPLDSTMGGQPFQASKFAATFRRYLYRKHLGLLPPQNMRQPDGHFMPAPSPNDYDYGCAEDRLVADPLSDDFIQHWNQVAHQNTLIFQRVFAPVPDDTIKTWLQYRLHSWKHLIGPDGLQDSRWGHVQKGNFSRGEKGAKEVKGELAKIRGTLVEMPLDFLVNTNIQMEDPVYNILTRQGYV
ncbi:phospholipase D/nuclease [Aspergillus varians]